MWYSNLFRRHLTDMHIEDWHSDFLSRFSPESYVENLEKAQVQYTMLPAQSHTGLCHYPTRTGNMHKSLTHRPNMFREVVDLCRSKGIRVCLYYSLIYNTREHDKHPQWRMLLPDGMSRRLSPTSQPEGLSFTSSRYRRYGFCCPNNPEYLDFLHCQIDEILDFFDFDAFFFDMPFWAHTCYCPHCREKYREIYGTDMPVEPGEKTEAYYRLNQFKYDQMAAFIQGITAYVKSKQPDMPVEHNFAQGIAGNSFAACGEEVAAASDFVGGDLYGDLINHAFACKFFRAISRTQPFEQMLSRCKPALQSHTLTKNLEELKTAVSVTMAHHGATLIIDALDPKGTQDARVYDLIGKVFAFQAPYEPYFTGTPVADVGIYYGSRSRVRKDSYNSLVCCTNLGGTLTKAHIPYDVTGSFASLEKYSVIAAPMLSPLETKASAQLAQYVRNGGTLYLSGCEDPLMVEALTGHRFLRQTKENKLYIAPATEYEESFGGFCADYPLPFEGTAPVVKPGENSTILATLTLPYTGPDELRYAAIHSDPPGIPTEIPAVTQTPLGKGQVIWSALPLEAIAHREYRDILLRLLTRDRHFRFGCDAVETLELTAYDQPDGLTFCAAVISEETTRVPGFEVWASTALAPKSVCLLPSGESIPFVYDRGTVRFQVPAVDFFAMYRIAF